MPHLRLVSDSSSIVSRRLFRPAEVMVFPRSTILRRQSVLFGDVLPSGIDDPMWRLAQATSALRALIHRFYNPWGLWAYPYYPFTVYDANAVGANLYLADAPAATRSYTPSYIEQPPAPSSYWYHYADPTGHYPYIQECNSALSPVAPQNVSPEQ